VFVASTGSLYVKLERHFYCRHTPKTEASCRWFTERYPRKRKAVSRVRKHPAVCYLRFASKRPFAVWNAAELSQSAGKQCSHCKPHQHVFQHPRRILLCHFIQLIESTQNINITEDGRHSAPRSRFSPNPHPSATTRTISTFKSRTANSTSALMHCAKCTCQWSLIPSFPFNTPLRQPRFSSPTVRWSHGYAGNIGMNHDEMFYLLLHQR
jgi:hypothetical protein